MKMKTNVNIKETTLIRPAEETPVRSLWVSDIDLVHIRVHMSTVHFYKSGGGIINGSAIEVVRVLKESLSQVLVPFYPVAGRLGRSQKGRIQVECNKKGVNFTVAETDSAMDELGNGEFAPNEELRQLVQTVDYDSEDSCSYPLALFQVTFFKCGGMSIGVALHHILFDGQSAMNFINSWARLARGLPVETPFHDRTLLLNRALPRPKFAHPEYDSPSIVFKSKKDFKKPSKPTSTCHLKVSYDQINTLKRNANANGQKFSSYEVLAAHIWRSTSLARGLANDEITRIYMAIDGRSRLNPPLPRAFCGNVVFPAVAIAPAGDILNESLSCTAERINLTIKRMDDEYLRSALAYLQQNPEAVECRQGNYIFRNPNHNIVSWSRISMNDANFGWGLPAYVGPAVIHSEGKGYITSSTSNDGGLGFTLSLETDHIQVFKKIFYEI